MIKVFNAYSMEEVNTFSTRKEAEKWLGEQAYLYNCGIFRYWTSEGYDFYDIGPRVYCIDHSAQ